MVLVFEQFSLRFAEIVLGGRINRAVLVQMIVRVLMHKGPMPVGEVGKNLQTMTGSDTLSKRLKEQFNGLKRAIEHSQYVLSFLYLAKPVCLC